VNSDKKFNVSHVKSEKHTKGLVRYEDHVNRKQQQLFALISANIPLNKLSYSKFKNFLEMYKKNEILCEATL